MPNRLINEQSPYLLQHAHNPVDWYAWGNEAFEKAKNENKPVLISIGYAACHWCHVMEHESFENEQVAAYMNEHFICIKVDREEHPDVDHLYMDAVQAITGSGGWPLNVFATPERIPFYGGTYFPPRPAFNRSSWVQLLQRITEIWTNEQQEVATQTEQMVQHLRQVSQSSITTTSQIFDKDSCASIAAALLKQADTENGGFGSAPKFPGTMAVSYLIEHYHYTHDKAALAHALHSLDAMIAGGIYDQLGGGFARYATDAAWLVPHFEKMLYDNALLITALCDAYAITGIEQYKKIIEETIGFIERELSNGAGGYFSAIDADSEGVEGKFYTWTWEEWERVIKDDAVAVYFGVTEEGNWEETNILHIAQGIDAVCAQYHIGKEELIARIARARQQLFEVRSARIRPLTDDKTLLSWNALMNISLSKAGVFLQDNTYLQRAVTHMDWLIDTFLDGDILWHTWKDGLAKISANLDDYAYLIQALIQLSSATGINKWLYIANRLLEKADADFIHESGTFYYYTAAQQTDIPIRKVDVYDGAQPSGNAVMANNLLLAGLYMQNSAWLDKGAQMLQKIGGMAVRYAYAHSYWAMLMQRHTAGMKIIALANPDAGGWLKKLQNHYLPHTFTITSEKEIFDMPVLANKFFYDKVLIFVCTGQACLTPVNTVEEVLFLV